MRVDIPFAELLALATSEKSLPDFVESVTAAGATVRAMVDLRKVPSDSLPVRLALGAAGVVELSAEIVDFDIGVASLRVTVQARGLPAHKLLPYLITPIDSAIRKRGLPAGLVRIDRGDGDPLVLLDVQKAVDSRVEGVTITKLRMRDAELRVDALINGFRRLE